MPQWRERAQRATGSSSATHCRAAGHHSVGELNIVSSRAHGPALDIDVDQYTSTCLAPLKGPIRKRP
jgi:hypothetical protein